MTRQSPVGGGDAASIMTPREEDKDRWYEEDEDHEDVENAPSLDSLHEDEDPAVRQYMQDMEEMVSTVSTNTIDDETNILSQQISQQTRLRISGGSPGRSPGGSPMMLSPPAIMSSPLSPVRNRNKFIQFLLGIEIDPMDAVDYQQKLNREGFASVASIRCSQLKRADLIDLGLKRGHAALIMSELRKMLLEEKKKKITPSFSPSSFASNHHHHQLAARKGKRNNGSASGGSGTTRTSPSKSPKESTSTSSTRPGGHQQSALISDPKRFDTMDTIGLCDWLDNISLGQYKPSIRRLHLSGARLLSMTQYDLKKIIPNRFHRQHLRSAAQSSQMEQASLSSLMHASATMSMCRCEACVFAAKETKTKRKLTRL